MNDYKELIEELRGGAEWAEANIYQVPIMLPNYLAQAAGAIEQLVRERDAAVKDLKIFVDCDVCKNNNDECLNNGLCKECSVGRSTRKHWEWRGVQE